MNDYFKDIFGQKAIRHKFSLALNQQKLHHGYIFAGPPGIGKEALAIELMKIRNCETSRTGCPSGGSEKDGSGNTGRSGGSRASWGSRTSGRPGRPGSFGNRRAGGPDGTFEAAAETETGTPARCGSDTDRPAGQAADKTRQTLPRRPCRRRRARLRRPQGPPYPQTPQEG